MSAGTRPPAGPCAVAPSRVQAMDDPVVVDVAIAVQPAKVWKALRDPVELRRWRLDEVAFEQRAAQLN